MVNNKTVLIGAGLSGPLMATYLTMHGYNVDIYEKRSDMRLNNISAGRSINLALSIRGIRALKEIGLYNEIKSLMIPMKGRMIHDLNGETNLHPYGKNNKEVIYSISRAELNKKLITASENTGKVQIFFEHELTNADLTHNSIMFNNNIEKSFDQVIGCDGSSSALRSQIIDKTNAIFIKNYSNPYSWKNEIEKLKNQPSKQFIISKNNHSLSKKYSLISRANRIKTDC